MINLGGFDTGSSFHLSQNVIRQHIKKDDNSSKKALTFEENKKKIFTDKNRMFFKELDIAGMISSAENQKGMLTLLNNVPLRTRRVLSP